MFVSLYGVRSFSLLIILSFGDLCKAHFKVNLDEECVMACDGSTKVIACASKRKQEKETDDSRVSITSLRCGNAAGNQGPTFILMKGKHKKFGFTDQFLENNGAAPGSTILMTPNAFMTDEAFDSMAHNLATGTRA